MKGGGQCARERSEPRELRPPLRIVIPALRYYPDWQTGSSRLAYDHARYLVDLGHDVWLVAMRSDTGHPEHTVDAGLHVLRYRRPRGSGLDPVGRHRRAVRRLLNRYVPRPVDVVHGHALLPTVAAIELYGRNAATGYSLHSPVRAELLAGGRGASIGERLRLSIAARIRSRDEATLLARCRLLTCESEFTRRLVSLIHGPAVARRIRVVPGWVDLARFRVVRDRLAARQHLGWPIDRPVLFCLRRFVPRMGLDRLLRAAALVRSTGRSFLAVLAGEGPLRDALRVQARSLDLSDSTEFPGVVEDDQLPTMYGAADAFVLPSAELECFGLIAIEAMACGTPVLATPVGAIPEILNGIEPRWLASDASAEALAGLLLDFLGGRLPVHPPDALRAFVRDHYSGAVRVPELAGALLEPEVPA